MESPICYFAVINGLEIIVMILGLGKGKGRYLGFFLVFGCYLVTQTSMRATYCIHTFVYSSIHSHLNSTKQTKQCLHNAIQLWLHTFINFKWVFKIAQHFSFSHLRSFCLLCLLTVKPFSHSKSSSVGLRSPELLLMQAHTSCRWSPN